MLIEYLIDSLYNLYKLHLESLVFISNYTILHLSYQLDLY